MAGAAPDRFTPREEERKPDEKSQRAAGSRFRDRDHRAAPVRRLRRASRPLRLRRHLRARPPERGRARLPAGRARPRARARADDHALPRRQLRIGLQLGGRRRPGRGTAETARPRLVLDRAEYLRHERVRRLVPRGGHRADAGGQSRHARRRRRPQHGRVLQPSRRHPLFGPAAQPRLRGAARDQVLVPRQRDGWPVADGIQDRDPVRPRRQGGGEDDALDRSDDRAFRLRVLRPQHAELRALGG